jgi:putative sterol carrier protein
VRGWCGQRQVPNVKYALQHNVGLGGAVVVTLYAKGFPGTATPGPNKAFGYNPAVEARPVTDREVKLVQTSGSQFAPLPTAAAAAGSIAVPGFKSSDVFEQLRVGLEALPAAERTAMVGKVKGVFQFVVTNDAKQTQTWTVDLKNGTGSAALGAQGKADIAVSVADQDFTDLAAGKLNGQKAFMSGKIKVKGNMMLATKLETVLKTANKAAAKL